MNSNSNNLGYKVAIGAMIAIIAIMGWFMLKHPKGSDGSKTDTEQAQHENLITQLDSLLAEHEKVKESYHYLNKELSDKDSIISAKADEIKQLLVAKSELKDIKIKLNQLQTITRTYEKEIDSLNNANKTLQEENEQIKIIYNIEQQKTSNLEKDKQELKKKISGAAILKAYKVSAQPFNVRGVNKERATDKANRTDMIRVCFTLGENKLAIEGYTRLFVRIAKPDNSILTLSDEYKFDFLGQTLQFSCMQSINFEGEAIDVCTQYEHPSSAEQLPKGRYYVNIFTEDREIGQTTFELK